MIGELERCNTTGSAKVDWLIKWNLRKTEVQALAALLDVNAHTRREHPRAGKRVTVWAR